MDIRPLDRPEGLEPFLRTQPLSPFLQSWAWGEFQHSLGRRIWRFGAFQGSDLVGAALAIEHQLVFGRSYLYCPRGPVATSPEVFQGLAVALSDLGKQHQAMYLKIDPGLSVWPWSDLKMPSTWQAGTTLQPRQTRLIDTAQSPAKFLAACHQKTRYNIRLAEKRGVTVRWSINPNEMDIFLRLMHQTYDRQGIRLHADSYYRRQFDILRANEMAELVIADYEGQPVAANMIIWHGASTTYLHGGSSDEHKDVMAPHLIQWRTVERAHQRGVTTYDLWGVAPTDQPNHHWQGVSRFKRGFAGREVELPAAINIILQPQWYQTYRWAKRFRGGIDE